MRSWLSWPALLQTLFAHVRLAVRLVREPRVPVLMKALPLGALLYVVSPIDLIPDVLPVLGEIDDLSLVVIALVVFLRLCPAAATAFHRAAIAQGRRYSPMPSTSDFIDAEWRRE
ncbi:MAG: DUF1232 domain-containing protein [Vicinamibacterales bacterium]